MGPLIRYVTHKSMRVTPSISYWILTYFLQPVELCNLYRSIPLLLYIRPADAEEAVVCACYFTRHIYFFEGDKCVLIQLGCMDDGYRL